MTSVMSHKGTGQYNRPIQRLWRVLSTDTHGAPNWTYALSGDFWYASIEQTGSEETEINGRTVTKTTAKITIKNWIPLDQYANTVATLGCISTLDKLIDVQFNQTYWITSIARGVNEMVITGYHL